MPTPEQDIKFFKCHLGMLQLEYEALLYRVTPEDMYTKDNIPDFEASPVFEKAARLAYKYGFDDSIFRDIIPGPPQDFEEFASNFEEWKKEQAEKIKKQIATIPQIIAKIEKAVETVRDGTNEPKDLIDLTKALTQVYISRSQIKRDIYDGKIKSYRKNPKGKHIVSLAEIQKVYLTK